MRTLEEPDRLWGYAAGIYLKRNWGIGLAVDDPRSQAPQQWKGQNLLGTVLMEVRSDLRCWVAASDGKVGYIDATDMPTNEIWSMPFQEVCRLPRIKEAIDIYGEVT